MSHEHCTGAQKCYDLSMCDEGRRQQYLLDEYKEVGTNWRYWGEVRWKQLTAFLTVSTLIGAAVYTAPRATDRVRVTLAIAGVMLAVLFWILEERATYYRRAYLHRALEIEQEWFRWVHSAASKERQGPRQYHVTHNMYWPHARSEHVFRFFYAMVIWLWALYVAAVAFYTASAALAVFPVAIALVLTCCGFRRGKRLQSKAADLDERGLTVKRLPRDSRSRSSKSVEPESPTTDRRDQPGECVAESGRHSVQRPGGRPDPDRDQQSEADSKEQRQEEVPDKVH